MPVPPKRDLLIDVPFVTCMSGRDDDGHGMISATLHAAVVDKMVNVINVELKAMRDRQLQMEQQLVECLTDPGSKLRHRKRRSKMLHASGTKGESSFAPRDTDPNVADRETHVSVVGKVASMMTDHNLLCEAHNEPVSSATNEAPQDAQGTGDVEVASRTPYGRVTHTQMLSFADQSVDRLKQHKTTNLDDTGVPLWRQAVQKWVEHIAFDGFFSFLIILNVIFIGAETEYSTTNDKPALVFAIFHHLFCIMFIIELAMRILASSCREMFFGKNWAWGWFDLVMVAVSIAEVADNVLITNSVMLRLARTVRLARVLRVLRFSPQLMILILMIMDSVASLMYALILISIVLYVFSICFTMGATDYLKDNEENNRSEDIRKFYGTVFRSVYTLYKSLTNGQSWGECLEPMFDMGWLYCAIFLCWTAFSVLAMLNVITGFFVDSAIAKSAQERGLMAEKELSRKKKLVQTLKEIFVEGDTDQTGLIELSEFMRHLRDERVAAYLAALHIDTRHLAQLFQEIDDDGSGAIDMEEFVENMQQVIGANSLDQNVQRLLVENRQLYAEFTKLNNLVRKNLLV